MIRWNLLQQFKVILLLVNPLLLYIIIVDLKKDIFKTTMRYILHSSGYKKQKQKQN